jgi:hypothetical protein
MATIFDFTMDDEGRKNFLRQDAARRRKAIEDALSPEVLAAEQQAAQAMRDAEDAQRAAVHEAALRDSIRYSYMVANGSETGFEAAYPGLRAQYVAQRTLANVIDTGSDTVSRFIARMNEGA